MTMSQRKVRDAQDARACLRAVAASGSSRAAWARDHGVDARSLNAWRLNLERSQQPPVPTELHLVELVPTERLVQAPAVYVVRCGDLAVEVDDRFDDDVLRRLIAVVASC